MQDSSSALDTRSIILSPRPRSWITDWFASCYLGLFIMLPTTLFVAKRISNKIIITWMSCNLASWPWVIQTEKILLVTSYKNPNLFAIHAHNETRKKLFTWCLVRTSIFLFCASKVFMKAISLTWVQINQNQVRKSIIYNVSQISNVRGRVLPKHPVSCSTLAYTNLFYQRKSKCFRFHLHWDYH